MINIKILDLKLLGISKISSFKNTDIEIYHIEYIAMKILYHVNIDIGNSHYLIFNDVDGYIEENNGNNYLIFA